MSVRHQFTPRGRPRVGVVQVCVVCGLQRTLELVLNKGPRQKRGIRFRRNPQGPWRATGMVCSAPTDDPNKA